MTHFWRGRSVDSNDHEDGKRNLRCRTVELKQCSPQDTDAVSVGPALGCAQMCKAMCAQGEYITVSGIEREKLSHRKFGFQPMGSRSAKIALYDRLTQSRNLKI